MPTTPPRTVADLVDDVLRARHGHDPAELTVTSAFWLHNTTRLPGAEVTYRNHYALLRLGTAFGACAFEDGELAADFCASASGMPVATLLADRRLPVRIAALDAYLAAQRPHHGRRVELPAGTPHARARARDAAVAGLLDVPRGAAVALIGVVNPLVAAIEDRGARCLPCDLNLRATQWGQPVTDDMHAVLDVADAVVATGMTLGNGTFDTILARCRERAVPLTIYAQTGSAVARAFLGAGVSALCAEPFPFSQFSADATTVHLYRDGDGSA